jgi:hypothetical protein
MPDAGAAGQGDVPRNAKPWSVTETGAGSKADHPLQHLSSNTSTKPMSSRNQTSEATINGESDRRAWPCGGTGPATTRTHRVARSTVDWQRQFDFDFVKVTPDSTSAVAGEQIPFGREATRKSKYGASHS